MARRLAAVGYFVVLPNLYYRLTRDFWLTERTEAMMAHMFSLMATLDAATTLCDTDAMLRFVDAQPRGRRPPHRRGRLLHERAVRDVGGRGAARSGCAASPRSTAPTWSTDKPDSPHRMPPQDPLRELLRLRRDRQVGAAGRHREAAGGAARGGHAAPPRVVSRRRARLRLSAARRHLRPGRGRASLGAAVQPVRAHAARAGLMARRWNGWGSDADDASAVGARPAAFSPSASASRCRRSAPRARPRCKRWRASRLPAATAFRTDPAIAPRPCLRPEHARLDRAAQRPDRAGRRRRRPAGIARRGRRRARGGEAARRARHSLRRRHQRRRPPARARGRPAGGQHLARAAGGAAGDRRRTDLTARFGAGAPGPAIEAALAAHGMTLGHFPQSFELSTAGGWVVTRSSGQQSLRYGRIEQLFHARPAGDAARRARGRRPAGVERRARPARGGARQRRPARPPDRGDAAHPAARRARALPRDLLSALGRRPRRGARAGAGRRAAVDAALRQRGRDRDPARDGRGPRRRARAG